LLPYGTGPLLAHCGNKILGAGLPYRLVSMKEIEEEFLRQWPDAIPSKNTYAPWWYEFRSQWTWAILSPVFAIDSKTPSFVATCGGIGGTSVLSTRFENAKQFEAFAKPDALSVLDDHLIPKNAPKSISRQTKYYDGSVPVNTEDVLHCVTRAQCTASELTVSTTMHA